MLEGYFEALVSEQRKRQEAAAVARRAEENRSLIRSHELRQRRQTTLDLGVFVAAQLCDAGIKPDATVKRHILETKSTFWTGRIRVVRDEDVVLATGWEVHTNSDQGLEGELATTYRVLLEPSGDLLRFTSTPDRVTAERWADTAIDDRPDGCWWKAFPSDEGLQRCLASLAISRGIR